MPSASPSSSASISFCAARVGQRLERRLGLGDDLGVVFGLAQLDQLDIVRQILADAAIGVHGVDQRLAVAHQFLRLVGIVPEVGVLDPGVEFLQPVLGGVPVQPLAQQVQRLLDRLHGVLRLGPHECLPPLDQVRGDSNRLRGGQGQ